MTTTEIATTGSSGVSTVASEIQAGVDASFGRHDAVRDETPRLTLEDVRDELVSQWDSQDPTDYFRTPDTMQVLFTHGEKPLVRLIQREGGGSFGEPMPITRYALKQLSSWVLGTDQLRRLKMLNALTGKDEQAGKIATAVWFKFAKGNTKELRLRTVQHKGQPLIRGVVTPDFTPYDDLNLVEDILAEMGNLPVFDWRRWGYGFRLRAALDSTESLSLDTPVPMLEAFNGEAGNKGIWITGGTYRLTCTNGCGMWADKAAFKRNHVGDVDHISEIVASALDNVAIRATGVLRDYEAAAEAQFDDLLDGLAFIDEVIAPHISEANHERVKVALDHPTTSSRLLLTSVFDAVTLAAQGQIDAFAQRDMETIALTALHQGLNRRDNDGKVRVRQPIGLA